MHVFSTAGKPRARWGVRLAAVLLIAALAAIAAVAAGHGAQAPAAGSHAGLEVVPLEPDAKKALKAAGRLDRSRFDAHVNSGKKFNPPDGTVPTIPTAGEQNVLVLFVEFTTPPPGAPAARLDMSYYDAMLFGTKYDPPEYAAAGFTEYPTDRTLRNYYDEVSYGKVNIVTADMPSALGWAQSGKPYEYYCTADGVHDNGFGAYPQNVQGLVVDAVKAVDEKVDFRDYAVNGEVPNLFVVFAGTGAEWSGAYDIIWSHSWSLSEESPLTGGYVTDDGTVIDDYAMMPELGGDLTAFSGVKSGPYPPTVGVFAHEYAHVLGLPDQYDYGYESEGTGNFSLMAGGSWNRYPIYRIFAGNSPAHLDAWSKAQLEFLEPIEETGLKVLPPVESEPVVYKMSVPGSQGREYFLFENRQKVGFDQGLIYRPTGTDLHGLAVYHVDNAVFALDYWRPNEAENWKEFRSEGWRKAENGATHYAISLLQADDRWDLEHGVNGGDPGDLYPGAGGVTSLGSRTRPNTSSYYFWSGNAPKFGYSGVTASGIAESGGNVSLTLSLAQYK